MHGYADFDVRVRHHAAATVLPCTIDARDVASNNGSCPLRVVAALKLALRCG